jgi:hypothetical protein
MLRQLRGSRKVEPSRRGINLASQTAGVPL